MRKCLPHYWWLPKIGFALALIATSATFGQAVPVLRGGLSDVGSLTSAEANTDLSVVFNRPIVVLRATVYEVSPSQRVRRIEQRIEELRAWGKGKELTTRKTAEGTMIELDGEYLLMIAPGDVDPMSNDTVDTNRSANKA